MFIFYLLSLSAYRIIKLKGSDLFITHKQDRLVQEKATFDNIDDQYIVVHDRILYFYKNRVYYTLGVSKKDIEVKVVESEFGRRENNKKQYVTKQQSNVLDGHGREIGYMEKRKTLDLFNLGHGHDKKDEEDKGSSEARKAFLLRLKKRNAALKKSENDAKGESETKQEKKALNMNDYAMHHLAAGAAQQSRPDSIQGNITSQEQLPPVPQYLDTNTQYPLSNVKYSPVVDNTSPYPLSNIKYGSNIENAMPYPLSNTKYNSGLDNTTPYQDIKSSYLSNADTNSMTPYTDLLLRQQNTRYPDDTYTSFLNESKFIDDNFEPKDKKKKSHVFESDSSMDDDYSLLFKDIIVKEVDSEYFQLAADQICVTFYSNKFIFAPCSSRNEKQLFTMVRSDDILRDLKRNIETTTVISTTNKLEPVTVTKTEQSVSTVTITKEAEKINLPVQQNQKIEKGVEKSTITQKISIPKKIPQLVAPALKTIDMRLPEKMKFDDEFDKKQAEDPLDDKNNFLARLENSFSLKGLDLGTID